MTDNGSSFRSRRYAKALRRLKIKHLRTKPYTPKTNGKAERFVQTSLREWAYATPTTPPTNAPPNCPSGFTATTGIAPMAVSEPSPQSADSASADQLAALALDPLPEPPMPEPLPIQRRRCVRLCLPRWALRQRRRRH